MFFHSLRRSTNRGTRPAKRGHRRVGSNGSYTFKPRLEALEDRITPGAIKVVHELTSTTSTSTTSTTVTQGNINVDFNPAFFGGNTSGQLVINLGADTFAPDSTVGPGVIYNNGTPDASTLAILTMLPTSLQWSLFAQLPDHPIILNTFGLDSINALAASFLVAGQVNTGAVSLIANGPTSSIQGPGLITGGTVILSAGSISGLNLGVTFGGTANIIATVPATPIILNSLDLTDATVTTDVQHLQSSQFVTGTLSGSGIITGGITVANQFNPRVHGLTVNGDVSLGANCQSNFTLAGLGAGTFSQLRANLSIKAAGTLNVTDLVP